MAARGTSAPRQRTRELGAPEDPRRSASAADCHGRAPGPRGALPSRPMAPPSSAQAACLCIRSARRSPDMMEENQIGTAGRYVEHGTATILAYSPLLCARRALLPPQPLTIAIAVRPDSVQGLQAGAPPGFPHRRASRRGPSRGSERSRLREPGNPTSGLLPNATARRAARGATAAASPSLQSRRRDGGGEGG